MLLHPAPEQTSKVALLAWRKRLDHSLRKVGLRQGWIGSTKITNGHLEKFEFFTESN